MAHRCNGSIIHMKITTGNYCNKMCPLPQWTRCLLAFLSLFLSHTKTKTIQVFVNLWSSKLQKIIQMKRNWLIPVAHFPTFRQFKRGFSLSKTFCSTQAWFAGCLCIFLKVKWALVKFHLKQFWRIPSKMLFSTMHNMVLNMEMNYFSK